MADDGSQKRKRDITIAAGAGAAVALFVGLVTHLIGSVGGLEAKRLLEALLPTSQLLCSAVMGVTATILALMLTLLSVGVNLEKELEDAHYHRIKTIGLYGAITFCTTAVLFLLHCVPVDESKDMPTWWYPVVYYVILSGAALVTGAVVSTVALLYMALRDLVNIVGFPDSQRS